MTQCSHLPTETVCVSQQLLRKKGGGESTKSLNFLLFLYNKKFTI